MKLCVAGTRGYYGPAFYVATRMAIGLAIKQFSLNTHIDEIVSGMCKNSPDMIGVDLARECGAPLKEMPAAWEDLGAYPMKLGVRQDGGEYNKLAGLNRNKAVAEYLAQHDHLVILIWDGKSPGTAHFKKCCEKLNLRVFEHIPKFLEVDQ